MAEDVNVYKPKAYSQACTVILLRETNLTGANKAPGSLYKVYSGNKELVSEQVR
jgi:hypothetical protein